MTHIDPKNLTNFILYQYETWGNNSILVQSDRSHYR